MKTWDDKFPFINKAAHNIGLPVWDKPLAITNNSQTLGINVSTNEIDTVVLLPLVQPNTYFVNGMIACNVGDSVTFTMVAAADYASFGFQNIADSMSAQIMALTFMALDQNIFGYSDFEILDKRLFNYPNIDTLQRFCRIAPHEAPSNNVMELISYMYCYEVWVADNQGQLVGCAPGSPCNTGHNEVQCTTAYVWANFVGDGGGGTGGTGTGEGGTGGGSGGTGGGPRDGLMLQKNIKFLATHISIPCRTIQLSPLNSNICKAAP